MATTNPVVLIGAHCIPRPPGPGLQSGATGGQVCNPAKAALPARIADLAPPVAGLQTWPRFGAARAGPTPYTLRSFASLARDPVRRRPGRRARDALDDARRS